MLTRCQIEEKIFTSDAWLQRSLIKIVEAKMILPNDELWFSAVCNHLKLGRQLQDPLKTIIRKKILNDYIDVIMDFID
jgi:hypothetical protein